MLETTYLGLNLKNPIVPSSSPLSRDLGDLRRLEDSGAAAVVMYSLFEEEIDSESHSLDAYLTENTESYAEALSYFPEQDFYKSIGPDAYLNHIRQAKESLEIPVIGSLNGVSAGGWTRYAKFIEEAGADALELNLYYIPTDPMLTAEDLETMYLGVLREVKESVNIPIAMKLNPFFSAIPNMALQFKLAGADSLVLFNRFYQPDIDLETLEVVRRLMYSDSSEMRLPLRWIAILYGRVPIDLALTSGVHTAEDVLKAIAAGSSAVMMASALLENGPAFIEELLERMKWWLSEKEYDSIRQLRGSMSQINCPNPAAFERANYIKTIGSYS